MSKQTNQRLAPRAIDLRPPLAVTSSQQWYLVETAIGARAWMSGRELIAQPAPAKVRAIAWRI